ncbi:MAG: T9SS type A sorting domain-containing protein [Reichenbachiella sp.]|uniref:T9SS type A sorting domain-containing protein n=1 Tax=Reichenbachiella sp. TaxID=2184521 RepID=UPI0032644AA7
MLTEKKFLKLLLLSKIISLRYLAFFLLTTLSIDDLEAQNTVSHLEEPIWSSKLTQTSTFEESLVSLNLSDAVLRSIDKVEIDVAEDLFKKNILLEEKALEIHKSDEYDILFLRYYLSSSSDGVTEFENSVVSFPIEKLQPNDYLRETLVSINSNKNSGMQGTSPNHSDQIIGNDNDEGLLKQNYPNPFQTETKIQFELPSNFSSAKIVISDMNGRQLITFDSFTSKDNQIQIGRDRLSKGTYFYHLLVDDSHISTKKMIVR